MGMSKDFLKGPEVVSLDQRAMAAINLVQRGAALLRESKALATPHLGTTSDLTPLAVDPAPSAADVAAYRLQIAKEEAVVRKLKEVAMLLNVRLEDAKRQSMPVVDDLAALQKGLVEAEEGVQSVVAAARASVQPAEEAATARGKRASEALAKLRYHVRTKMEKTSAAEYAASLPKKGEHLDLSELVAPLELEAATQADVVAAAQAPDAFAKLVRTMYKCVASVAIQDDVEIGKSTIVRPLEMGELVEAMEVSEDEASKCPRVKILAPKDGKIGWATIVGNAGTPYLEKQD